MTCKWKGVCDFFFHSFQRRKYGFCLDFYEIPLVGPFFLPCFYATKMWDLLLNVNPGLWKIKTNKQTNIIKLIFSHKTLIIYLLFCSFFLQNFDVNFRNNPSLQTSAIMAVCSLSILLVILFSSLILWK